MICGARVLEAEQDDATDPAAATAATFDDLSYWQAANYLTLGQLYLLDNPLLTSPLHPEHLKARPAGPWSPSPTINLCYTQLNRFSRELEVPSAIVVGSPAATPAMLANWWLDGTYRAQAPEVARNAAGMLALFRRFGLPDAVPLPLRLRLGRGDGRGWLGAGALRGALRSACDGSNRLVLCVLSHSETLPALVVAEEHRAGGYGADDAVVPLIWVAAEPFAEREVALVTSLRRELYRAGYQPLVVARGAACTLHAELGVALRRAYAMASDASDHPRRGLRPAIVLRTPADWERPLRADGTPSSVEPDADGRLFAAAASESKARAALEEWLLALNPDERFRADGAPSDRLEILVPATALRVGAPKSA
jgi:xylulose-5-phosphate/fructose-6-phosphate phosphoketolase